MTTVNRPPAQPCKDGIKMYLSLDDVRIGSLYTVDTGGRQGTEFSLFQVHEVVHPEGWAAASKARRQALLKEVKLRGVWFYQAKETAAGVRLVNPSKLKGANRDPGDNRQFLFDDVDDELDERRVFLATNKAGTWSRTIPFGSLRKEVRLVHGTRPSNGGAADTYYYNQSYDELFMTYEQCPPSDVAGAAATGAAAGAAGAAATAGRAAAAAGPSQLAPSAAAAAAGPSQPPPSAAAAAAGPSQPPPPAAAAAAAARSLRPRAAKASTAKTSTQRQQPSRKLPKCLREPSPPDEDEEPSYVPLVPYLTAKGNVPSKAALKVAGGHRAGNPAARQYGKDDVLAFHACCGAGGASMHQVDEMVQKLVQERREEEAARRRAVVQDDGHQRGTGGVNGGRGGAAAAPVGRNAAMNDSGRPAGGEVTRGSAAAAATEDGSPPCPRLLNFWGCDNTMSPILSCLANHGEGMAVTCARLAELYVLIRLANELLSWLEAAADDNKDTGGGGGGGAADSSKRRATSRSRRGRKQQQQQQQQEQQEQQEGGGEQESKDQEGSDDDDAEEKEKEGEWEVADVVAMRLFHYVPSKDGQLQQELGLEDCGLEFLVRWHYDPVRHKKSWPDYPANQYQWLPLSRLLGSVGMLRGFMRRVLLTESLLPRPGMRILLVAGTPCQDMSGHNREIRKRELFDSPKNRIILTLLALASYLQVDYVLLEQVGEAAQLQDGKWFRTVVVDRMRAEYQIRVGLIRAAGHGCPQVRPRVFIWAAKPGCVLPGFPRPEFSARLLLRGDEEGKVWQPLRRRILALQNCYPMAADGALLYPSQTLTDAISNLEPRDNFSMSPVSTVTEFHHPLQYTLARPPPAGTPSAELRFAAYLGNCAPAILEFPRLVLLFYYACRKEAERAVKKRMAERRRRRAKRAAAAAAAGGTGGVAVAAAAAGASAATGRQTQTTGDTPQGDTSAMEAEIVDEACVRLGDLFAELPRSCKKSAGGEAEAEAAAQEAAAVGSKRKLQQDASRRRLSHLEAGKKLLRSSLDALTSSLQHAPHMLGVLRAERERLEGRTAAAAAGAGGKGSGGDAGAGAARTAAAAAAPAAAAAAPALAGAAAGGSGGAAGGTAVAVQAAAAAAAVAAAAARGRGVGLVAGGVVQQEGGAAGAEGAAGRVSRGAAATRGADHHHHHQQQQQEPGGAERRRWETVLSILVANHVPYQMQLENYERVKAVPTGGGKCLLDVPGVEEEGKQLRCGKPLLPESLRKWLKRQRSSETAGRTTVKRQRISKTAGRTTGNSKPYGRLLESQALGTVCGGGRMTNVREVAVCLPYADRIASPREFACVQGFQLHTVFLTVHSPFAAHLRRHTGTVSWLEGVVKPAIRGLKWLLQVGPAVAAAAAAAAAARQEGCEPPSLQELRAAWHMQHRVIKDEMQQIGNSWAAPVAEGLGRCFALALVGLPSLEGQESVPDPNWQAAWQWAGAAGVRCVQSYVQDREGLWPAEPQEVSQAPQVAEGDPEALLEESSEEGEEEEEEGEEESEEEEGEQEEEDDEEEEEEGDSEDSGEE
ncbi:hypothetical protein Agub_g14055 [Astrephomene gubernaculifera]|uniref:DNA (cytosine-5-)-methyltransferase n=1 Tax=Astrephomene gubernaculifera TaxID=47775 RepID=A0AAD3E1A1_9CHLO|nr:hypothetical protein Agub_g14055 [Astrephomene gubernaculifera]